MDKHQRFTYCLSKHRNIFEPVVSDFLIKNGCKITYPNNKKFAVCLTHDIDVIYFTIGEMICEIKQKPYKLKILFHRVNKNINPLWNFTKIIELEKKYEAKSTFFFLALEKGDFEFNFRIDKLAKELKNIIENGYEVGLHGGYESYNNLDKIKKEKERIENVIGKEVIGYRNHYLRFKVPTTWELLKEAGFKYDTTFGYNDCVGFRNGMCHPFKPFNLNTNEYIDILEIPLTIMDRTLIDYMQLDIKMAWEITKHLIDIVAKYNGVITILWHNMYMRDELLLLYEEILKYCKNLNAWLTSAEEIWHWWTRISH